MKFLKDWKWYNYFYYFICIIVLITCTIIYSLPIISLIVSLCSVTGGMLNVKGQRIFFAFYVVQVSLYGYYCLDSDLRLYGETIINWGYMLPVYFYSLIRLFRKKEDVTEVKINHINLKTIILLILIGMLFIPLVGYLLPLIGSEYSYLNSISMYVYIVAAYLASRCIKEQWYIWLLFNVVQITLWGINLNTETNNLHLLLQNIMYVGINTMGLISWIKMSHYRKDVQISDNN